MPTDYYLQECYQTGVVSTRGGNRPIMAQKKKAKILLLDDEQDLVDLYREILNELPSKPDVHTTTSGAQAISILESEPFTLLLCDLSMPKMDGLQVLAIVRRKFPQLRTAILTSMVDEQFRSRAYSMGVDLFLEKPSTKREIKLLKDCIESLLDQEAIEGFRGVQSKSLIDIIQMEGLSQSSSILKVTDGKREGQIWFVAGEITDAQTGPLRGEEAFFNIMSWKTGRFETLPADARRPRSIFTSYHALLLESARKTDEGDETADANDPHFVAEGSPLSEIASKHGVEFVLKAPKNKKEGPQSWGLENPDDIFKWMEAALDQLNTMGDRYKFGELQSIVGTGPQRNVGMLPSKAPRLCIGFHRSQNQADIQKTMKEIVEEELC